MIYLILAVTSSMLVSVIMRVSEKHIHGKGNRFLNIFV